MTDIIAALITVTGSIIVALIQNRKGNEIEQREKSESVYILWRRILASVLFGFTIFVFTLSLYSGVIAPLFIWVLAIASLVAGIYLWKSNS